MHACLFTLDGVIANTAPLKLAAHGEAMSALGGVFEGAPDPFAAGPGGMGAAGLTEAGVASVGVAGYGEAWSEAYEALLASMVAPVAGARTLLKALRSHGWRLALVSTDRRDHVAVALDRAGLDKYFSVVVDQAALETPFTPALPYQRALAALAGPLYRAGAVVDAGTALLGARAAGLATVAVRGPHNERQTPAGADRIVEQPLEPRRVLAAVQAVARPPETARSEVVA